MLFLTSSSGLSYNLGLPVQYLGHLTVLPLSSPIALLCFILPTCKMIAVTHACFARGEEGGQAFLNVGKLFYQNGVEIAMARKIL